jgi:hypothetical protein
VCSFSQSSFATEQFFSSSAFIVQFLTGDHVEQYGRFLLHGALGELQGNFGHSVAALPQSIA